MTPNEKPASPTQGVKAQQALRDVIAAWEATKDGTTSVSEIQRWLIEDMAPAINAARATLSALDRTTLPPEGMDPSIREAVQLAVDFLKETKRGNGARSPGHNARLVLEAALAAAPQGTRT